MTIRIKNWSKHQHFKDRTPPWIKLYREILDDPDWHDLSGDDAKLLVGLWLVASEDNSRSGALPESRKLAFRMRIQESELNQAINRLSQWLIHDDINTISEHNQLDAPETETETETEEKILPSGDGDLPAEPKPKAPAIPYDDILAAYHEALPMLPAVRLLTDARRKKIKSRWHELAERQTREYWQRFFAYAAQSDFLTGRSGKWTSCNFDWLMEPGNHLKVVEGNYENRDAQP